MTLSALLDELNSEPSPAPGPSSSTASILDLEYKIFRRIMRKLYYHEIIPLREVCSQLNMFASKYLRHRSTISILALNAFLHMRLTMEYDLQKIYDTQLPVSGHCSVNYVKLTKLFPNIKCLYIDSMDDDDMYIAFEVWTDLKQLHIFDWQRLIQFGTPLPLYMLQNISEMTINCGFETLLVSVQRTTRGIIDPYFDRAIFSNFGATMVIPYITAIKGLRLSGRPVNCVNRETDFYCLKSLCLPLYFPFKHQRMDISIAFFIYNLSIFLGDGPVENLEFYIPKNYNGPLQKNIDGILEALFPSLNTYVCLTTLKFEVAIEPEFVAILRNAVALKNIEDIIIDFYIVDPLSKALEGGSLWESVGSVKTITIYTFTSQATNVIRSFNLTRIPCDVKHRRYDDMFSARTYSFPYQNQILPPIVL